MIAAGIILLVTLAATAPADGERAHQGTLNVSCLDCHTRLPFRGSTPLIRSEVGDLCVTCHKQYHGADAIRSHPIHAIPVMRIPPDMLLDHDGKIGCITCHAFHGTYRDEEGNKLFYLRRTPGRTFCHICHKRLPGTPIQSK